MTEQSSLKSNNSIPSFNNRKTLLFGKDSDSIIKAFFGSHAMVAIVILTLITIFLFKEGAGFLGQYNKSIRQYRLSGLEYVDILKEQRQGYVQLNQYLDDIKAKWIQALRRKGLSQEQISAIIYSPEANAVFVEYKNIGSDLYSFIQEKRTAAIKLRDRYLTYLDLDKALSRLSDKITAVESPEYKLDANDHAKLARLLEEKDQKENLRHFEDKGITGVSTRETYLDLLRKEYAAFEANIQPIDLSQSIQQVSGEQDRYIELLDKLAASINRILVNIDQIDFGVPEIANRAQKFKSLNALYIGHMQDYKEDLANWDPTKPFSIWFSIGTFLTGKTWITASDQQDWYGILPLLTGSLLISLIALFLAVPFGVGAAIYTNQIAGPAERNFIKPYIEFISAIPSVVIGFFGIVVFGETMRQLSQLGFLQWVPFFPIQERLNAFTAGCLLALMAIPTIFTLAEDAINNIPDKFTEASLAVGASKLQTTFRIIIPSALSGIISAVMLGFGRVIGETMVVLLCAGNRIKIPDFTQGIGVFFEPVHTMTGIIAQEMGEVVRGSLHYRALFMVGIVLFFISMLINYSAQRVVKKYNKLHY